MSTVSSELHEDFFCGPPVLLRNEDTTGSSTCHRAQHTLERQQRQQQQQQQQQRRPHRGIEASTEKASSRGPMAKLARYNDAWTKKCFLDCSGKRKHPSIKGNSGRRPMWWAPAFSWANQCRYPHHLDEATPARLTFRTGDRSSRPGPECVHVRLGVGKTAVLTGRQTIKMRP